jgi:O-acetylserine/cysteine efflux transporter
MQKPKGAPMSPRSFLLLMFVCLLWAGNTIVSRLVVGTLGVPPLWFAAMRALVVMVVLLPWLRPLPSKPLQVMLVTFAISGASFALTFIGLRQATPSATSIVSLSNAPLTVLFAIPVLGERVHWRRGVGVTLAFAGVVVAIASPEEAKASVGLLYVLAGAVASALGAVYLKRIELEALRLQAWAGASSVAVLLPLSLALEQGQWETMAGSPGEFVAALAFSALAVSVLAHTLYYRFLQTHDANLVAPLTLMTPVFTVVMGVLITGDPVGVPLIAGGLMAAAGVLVIVLRPSALIFKPLLIRSRL